MSNFQNPCVELAKNIGIRPDYFQGGGGNLSYKTSDSEMAIKASGYRIDDIKSDTDLARVHYQPISSFYNGGTSQSRADTYINDAKDIVEANTIHSHGTEKKLRPSMEVGFHSILGRCVLHSHSVYANILNCTHEGPMLIRNLFPESRIVPYAIPGAPLTRLIQSPEDTPQIVFLQNHGLIVHGDSVDEVMSLHEMVNDCIQTHLSILAPYPTVEIISNGEGVHESNSSLISTAPNKTALIQELTNHILFPDQAVYFDISILDTGKISIQNNDSLYYACPYAEALALEETLAAYLYIKEVAKRANLSLKHLSDADRGDIANLEAEKHRKNVITS